MSSRSQTSDPPPKRYRALTHIEYPTGEVDLGDIVEDLPPISVVWLLSDGLIEEVND